MDQDTITWTGVRAPGVKRFRPLERWCISAPRPPTLNGDTTLQAARCTKDGCQPRDTNFLRRRRVNAPSDRPTFQPYWGKPAVRMIGGTMETAASFEARFAPWSYPTAQEKKARAAPSPGGGRACPLRAGTTFVNTDSYLLLVVIVLVLIALHRLCG